MKTGINQPWAKSVLVALMALVVVAVAASPAGAIVTKLPSGKKLSYVPLAGRASAPSGLAANGNLDYHSGPVMPSMNQFAIFWAPAGFSFPPGYESAIVKYMQDLSADSGKASNTTSVGTQYTDSTGARAGYGASFGGSFEDATAYPANGCPPYSGAVGPAFTKCLTDAQLRNEINGFVSAHGLPRGLTNSYVLFLPDGVGSCVDALHTACFDKQFCAYHSNTVASGTQTIYANESFTPRDPARCGNHNYPNGHANGNVDDQLSTLSHESNEAREDPLLNAWFNSNTGDEGADQCRNTGNDYGPLLGGTFGFNGFNQIINGAPYILQMDWSNAAIGCEQRYNLTGSVSGPGSAFTGQALAFSASGVDTEGGGITDVTIAFGDGTRATGTTASHAYSAPGTYNVTATVTNTTGLTTTVAGPTVTVTAPPPPSNHFTFGNVKLNKKNGTAKLPVTVRTAGKLTLKGRGIKPIRKAQPSAKAVGAGTTKLTVKAMGKALKRLKHRGKVKVIAKVAYTPNGGTARTKSKKIRLIRRR